MCCGQRGKWYKGCKVNLWNIKLISVQYLMTTVSEHYLCKHRTAGMSKLLWSLFPREKKLNWMQNIGKKRNLRLWGMCVKTDQWIQSLWCLSVKALPWFQESRICSQVWKKQLLCDRTKYNFYFPRKILKKFFQRALYLSWFCCFLEVGKSYMAGGADSQIIHK